MKAVRLIGLTACLGALAACNDLPTTTQPIDKVRLAMGEESLAEAVRLDSLADNAEAGGKEYRPLLLRAIIDALQFGVPMTTANVTINGDTARQMRVVQMNAIVVDTSLTPDDSTGFAFTFAWSGVTTGAANKVDTVIVVGRPYDPDTGIWGTTQAFFLDATVDDTPWLLTSGSADFSLLAVLRVCPDEYDNETQLPAPEASACHDQSILGSFDVTVQPIGSQSSKALFMDDLTTTGVRVVRTSKLVPSAAIARVRQLMQR